MDDREDGSQMMKMATAVPWKHLLPVFMKREKYCNTLPFHQLMFAQVVLESICEQYPPSLCGKPKCELSMRVLEAAMNKKLDENDLRVCLKVVSEAKLSKEEDRRYQSFYEILVNCELARILFESYDLGKKKNHKRYAKEFREFLVCLQRAALTERLLSGKCVEKDASVLLNHVVVVDYLLNKMDRFLIFHRMAVVLMGLNQLNIIKSPPLYAVRHEYIFIKFHREFNGLMRRFSNFEGLLWTRKAYEMGKLPHERPFDNMMHMTYEKQISPILMKTKVLLKLLGIKFSEYAKNREIRIEVGRFCNFCMAEKSMKKDNQRWRGFKLCAECKYARYCCEDCRVADVEGHKMFCDFFKVWRFDYDAQPTPILKKRDAGFVCEVCGLESSKDFGKCSGCKKVYYCSKKCQVLDWKYGHKKICKSQ